MLVLIHAILSDTPEGLQEAVTAFIADNPAYVSFGEVYKYQTQFVRQVGYADDQGYFSQYSVITDRKAVISNTPENLAAALSAEVDLDSAWQPFGLVYMSNGLLVQDMVKGTPVNIAGDIAVLQDDVTNLTDTVATHYAQQQTIDGRLSNMQQAFYSGNVGGGNITAGIWRVAIDDYGERFFSITDPDPVEITIDEMPYNGFPQEAIFVDFNGVAHTIVYAGDIFDGSSGGPFTTVTFSGNKGAWVRLRFYGLGGAIVMGSSGVVLS